MNSTYNEHEPTIVVLSLNNLLTKLKTILYKTNKVS